MQPNVSWHAPRRLTIAVSCLPAGRWLPAARAVPRQHTAPGGGWYVTALVLPPAPLLLVPLPHCEYKKRRERRKCLSLEWAVLLPYPCNLPCALVPCMQAWDPSHARSALTSAAAWSAQGRSKGTTGDDKGVADGQLRLEPMLSLPPAVAVGMPAPTGQTTGPGPHAASLSNSPASTTSAEFGGLAEGLEGGSEGEGEEAVASDARLPVRPEITAPSAVTGVAATAVTGGPGQPQTDKPVPAAAGRPGVQEPDLDPDVMEEEERVQRLCRRLLQQGKGGISDGQEEHARGWSSAVEAGRSPGPEPSETDGGSPLASADGEEQVLGPQGHGLAAGTTPSAAASRSSHDLTQQQSNYRLLSSASMTSVTAGAVTAAVTARSSVAPSVTDRSVTASEDSSPRAAAMLAAAGGPASAAGAHPSFWVPAYAGSVTAGSVTAGGVTAGAPSSTAGSLHVNVGARTAASTVSALESGLDTGRTQAPTNASAAGAAIAGSHLGHLALAELGNGQAAGNGLHHPPHSASGVVSLRLPEHGLEEGRVSGGKQGALKGWGMPFFGGMGHGRRKHQKPGQGSSHVRHAAAAVTAASSLPGVHLLGLRKVYRSWAWGRQHGKEEAVQAGSTSGGEGTEEGAGLRGLVRLFAALWAPFRGTLAWLRGACASVLPHVVEHAAVRGTWLSLPPGQCFCLLGPNGAGKTTTIKCLTGVRKGRQWSSIQDSCAGVRVHAQAHHMEEARKNKLTLCVGRMHACRRCRLQQETLLCGAGACAAQGACQRPGPSLACAPSLTCCGPR